MTLNPLFLFVLFSMGYVFGLLLKNPTAGKFLIFGFAGIFVYEPVKAAGLLASAIFVAGIISHHVTPFSIIDALPRLSLGSHSPREDRPSRRQRKQRSEESAQDTKRRYDEYRDRNRNEDSKAETKGKAEAPLYGRASANRNSQQASRDEDQLRRDKERLKREQDRLKTERQQFEREQAEKRPHPDNRTDEEILGVNGSFTLAELKSARNSEVKRWNTSNMRHKPVHLIAQAEEEAKKINLAYERLVEKFR